MAIHSAARLEELTHLLLPRDHLLTPVQLSKRLGGITKIHYDAILIHCMVFENGGRTLMLRHAGSSDIPPLDHEPWRWCTPWVTVESYLPEAETSGPATNLTIEDVVENALAVNIGLDQCMAVTKVLTAVQTSRRIASDGSRRPVLVVAVGVQVRLSTPISLYGTRWIDYTWAAQTKVVEFDIENGCEGMCRKPWFGIAARRWRHKRKPKESAEGNTLVKGHDFTEVRLKGIMQRTKSWKPSVEDVEEGLTFSCMDGRKMKDVQD